ncbi:CLUMA_CG003224, isoform A [Clunio marinus]|uniref:CLUMA_CG003224, isoform A n=1 Tax=Clunio marinus TaxID=568069 RepID=A0A1J1HN54_9DIPT|nr:CLUMA_CG003224, isoform A [Clunio marinus]
MYFVSEQQYQLNAATLMESPNRGGENEKTKFVFAQWNGTNFSERNDRKQQFFIPITLGDR